MAMALAAVLGAAPATLVSAAQTVCTGGTEWSTLVGKCIPIEGQPDRPPVPDAPTCQWRRVTMTELRRITHIDPNVQIGDGWFYVSALGGAVRRQGDRVQAGYIAYDCEWGARSAESDIEWRDEVTVDDLIPLVPESARRAIDNPEIFVSPPDRGFVNLGMWLAVSNAEPITLVVGDRATGPWVEVTATLTTSAWNMGNGDTVTCGGPGVVLRAGDPGWNSIGEGPCGYTYRNATPDDDTVTVSATATWTVTWLASDGRTNPTPADTIVVSNSTAYDVDEVQTVGATG